MHNRLISGYCITLLCLLWFGCHAQAAELQPYDGFLQSPPLTLDDLGHNRHDLMNYRGQVVLINFWATWCPPCIIEMPSMQRLKDKFAGKPFSILAVNVKESEGTIWKFHKMIQVDFPLLLDRDGQASEDWEVVVYPSSYLVDKSGEIRYQVRGMMKWDAPEVVRVIEAILDEVPAEGVAAPVGAPPPAR